MSSNVFRVEGRVVASDGRPLPGIRIAVAERDPLRDDLLGVGFTGDDGQFRLSFTQREFNLDPFERERRPELYVVLSTAIGERYVAIHRADLVGDGPHVVAINALRPAECAMLDGQAATPGYHGRVARLALDDATVAHCLEEVAPLVESLTGWRGLLDRLEVRMSLAVSPKVQELMAELGVSSTVTKAMMGGFLGAMYDPYAHAVLINKRWAERQNLDEMKVVLGHELVHVGQHLAHPELTETGETLTRSYFRAVNKVTESAAFTSIAEYVQRLSEEPAHQAMQEHMSNIEGYASYVEHGWLRRHYTCATRYPHMSLLQRIAWWAIRRLDPTAPRALDVKDDQYTGGRARYQALDGEGGPVGFSVTLPS